MVLVLVGSGGGDGGKREEAAGVMVALAVG